MAGALTLFLLLALSLTIVRAAGVALRLTGVPQPVARFQAISALTGAGYTTSEAEALMQHPTRRRILMLLMLTGHLGVVSLASTVILAIAFADGLSGIAIQVLAMLFAVGAIYALSASEALDRTMCDAIGRFMVRQNWISPKDDNTLFVHSSGQVLAEHRTPVDLAVERNTAPVRIVAINADPLPAQGKSNEPVTLKAGDTVLCVGTKSDHDDFGELLKPPTPSS